MLNNDDGRTALHERLKDAEQHLCIERIQTDRRLVKDEYEVLLPLAHITHKLQPLRLAEG